MQREARVAHEPGAVAEFLRLFLGEICYRFNHRDEGLFLLLYKLLRATGMNEINPISVWNR